MINHLLSIEKGLYLPESYENLLEFDNSPKDLYEENLKCLSEFNSDIVLLCNAYKGTSDPEVIKNLNESSIERIYDYMQKVSNNCQKAWDNFKKAKNTEEIIDVVNKSNQPYFQSGFRMQFPPGFKAPLIDKWNRLKDGAKIIILNEASFNANKVYMDTEDSFKQRFYRNFYDSNYDDFYDGWKRDIFVNTTGKEVIGAQEVAQFVNFLYNYNTEIDDIGKDIDNINATSANLKKMLSMMPVEETYEILQGFNQVINEIGFKFRDANMVQAKTIEKDKQLRSKEEQKLKRQEAKNDKKYIVTYYTVSMEILSSKMKLCNNIKKQSLKILKKYISIQPKKIKDNPKLGAEYAEMQAQRNANPNFQVKK